MGSGELGPCRGKKTKLNSYLKQGQVGATAGGLEFIDQEFILESILDIAEESPVYSLRG